MERRSEVFQRPVDCSPESRAALLSFSLYFPALLNFSLSYPLLSTPPQDIRQYVLRSLGEKRQLYYAMEHLGTSFKDPVSNSTSLHPTSMYKVLRIAPVK